MNYDAEIIESFENVTEKDLFKIKNRQTLPIDLDLFEQGATITNYCLAKIQNDNGKNEKEYYLTCIFCNDNIYASSSPSLHESIKIVMNYYNYHPEEEKKIKIIKMKSKNYDSGFYKCIL